MKKFFRSFFEKTYRYQGMVQFSEEGEPVICGIKARWLDEVTVFAISEKEAIRKACDVLNNKYPQYNGMVQLW